MIKIDLCKTLQAPAGKIQLDIKIDIPTKQLVTLYGPSGSGKTSTLKMIAGLLKPDKGILTVHEETWFNHSEKINISPQKRKIGYVFQEYALFPNMTVRKNLEFALQKNQDQKVLTELIEIMELGDLSKRVPKYLSGGQQQRVALARALVRMPEILLLDEPLSALDIEMRKSLQDYIMRLHKEYGLTTIMVSHDKNEIIKMSDLVYVVDQGKIQKQGDPKMILANAQPLGILKLEGEVISIETKNEVLVASVLVGNNVIRATIEKEEVHRISPGDLVIVSPNEKGVRTEKKNS